MTIPKACIRIGKGKRVSVSENGRSFVLLNENESNVDLITVDGCAITDGERCDFLYRLESLREIFVELKGSDVKKALTQLEASVPKLTQQKSKAERACVVVASRCPKEDSSTQIVKRRVISTVASRLRIKNSVLEIDEKSLFGV